MSIEIMNMVWTQSTRKGSSLLLLLAIADNANNKGEAYPGIDYLSRKVRMSRRQTQRLVQELDSSNELAVIWGGSGPKDAHFYFILVGKSPEEIQIIKGKVEKINAKREGSVPGRKNEIHAEPDNKGDNLTPFVDDQEKSDILSPFVEGTKKGDIWGKKGVKSDKKGDIAMSPEPLINREHNRQEESGAHVQNSMPENGHLPAPPILALTENEQTSQMPESYQIATPTEVQLYKAVTGRLPRRDQWPLIIRAWKNKPYSRETLLPFWEAWVARDHKRTSLGWLDWVERGEVPEPWAKKSPAGEDSDEPRGFRSIRQVMEEYHNGDL